MAFGQALTFKKTYIGPVWTTDERAKWRRCPLRVWRPCPINVSLPHLHLTASELWWLSGG